MSRVSPELSRALGCVSDEELVEVRRLRESEHASDCRRGLIGVRQHALGLENNALIEDSLRREAGSALARPGDRSF